MQFGFQRDEFEISNKRKECALFYQASAWSLFIVTFLYSREHNHNQLNFPISYCQVNAIDAWWKRQRDTTLEWCKLCRRPIIGNWVLSEGGMFIGMEWPSLCWLGLFKLLLYRSDKVAKIGITKDREKISVNDQENKKLEWLFLMWPLSPLKLYCDDWAQKET